MVSNIDITPTDVSSLFPGSLQISVGVVMRNSITVAVQVSDSCSPANVTEEVETVTFGGGRAEE